MLLKMRKEAQCGIKPLAPLQNSHTVQDVFGFLGFPIASEVGRPILSSQDRGTLYRGEVGQHPDQAYDRREAIKSGD